MFINFCHPSLRPDVTSKTISTDGYEVTNLINDSVKGFLAYSCIKPPVNIDFTFICNIQVSHIIVWPSVGAQKSTGFQLFVKSSDHISEPFTLVSNATLQKEDQGVVFYRQDINNEDISAPSNFIRRYTKSVPVMNRVNCLRLNIFKTDNSVPALGKIEVWGKVSSIAGKDTNASVMVMWTSRNKSKSLPEIFQEKTVTNIEQKIEEGKINVPEAFLDPITCEIMTQPIALPSGKIIDQSTLEKHESTEAIWGRPPSDPFTGLQFSQTRKPVFATALKSRIDQFLLDNSENDEIKKMPRVLGSEFPIYSNEVVKTQENLQSKSANRRRRRQMFHTRTLPDKVPRQDVDSDLESSIQRSLADLRGNTYISDESEPECKCCSNGVFYKLPCKHFICRKELLATKICVVCKKSFNSSDPIRIR